MAVKRETSIEDERGVMAECWRASGRTLNKQSGRNLVLSSAGPPLTGGREVEWKERGVITKWRSLQSSTFAFMNHGPDVLDQTHKSNVILNLIEYQSPGITSQAESCRECHKRGLRR